MDFNRSKALLNKINALHDSASAFGGSMSALERDLLLQYIRDLYEIVSSTEANTPSKTTAIKGDATQSSNPVAVPRPPEPPRPTPEYPHNGMQSPPPAHYSNPQHTTEDELKAGQYRDYPPKQNVQTTPVEPPRNTPKVAPSTAVMSSELSELFKIAEKDKDLVSQFNQRPISDIGKSMGINDKLLTINELFGGDQNAFSSVITKLNGLSDYEEAKTYLAAEVAVKYKWLDKINRAKEFLHLVNRRYM